jgi:hypothetical protein
MRPDEIFRRHEGASGPFKYPPQKSKQSNWGWVSVAMIGFIAALMIAVILLR